jgi:FemAB family protein
MTETLSALLAEAGLDAKFKCEAEPAWDVVWNQLAYQPVAYARSMLDYQHAYYRGAGWQLEDASLVLCTDGRPCGLWPLSFGGPEGSTRLTSAGAPILAPLFVGDLSPRTVKKIVSRQLALVELARRRLGVADPTLEQSASPQGDGACSEWQLQWMAAGAAPTLRHDLYADLRPPLPDIRASFRKSFRPLINVGLRNWQAAVLDQHSITEPVWAEFKELHKTVAGRSTRSDETWEKQFLIVRAGEGFLVTLRDPADARLVGAGLFQHTRDEGLYAVGAYDRSLFDKPLGHVVQQLAIETLKAHGVRWYRIGERHFAQDIPAPSDKQLAIAAFKQGFASHVMPRVEFHHSARPSEGAEE